MNKWTNEEIEILRTLYLKRILIRKISRILNRSEIAISMKIGRIGLYKERKRLLIEAIKREVKRGCSDYKIALMLKVNRNTISNYRKKG